MWRLVVVALAACSFRPNPEGVAGVDGHTPPADAARDAGSAGSAGWLAGYPYRKPVVITAGAALADFPVSVLVTDGELASHALGGSDIVFTAADGASLLPSEIVAFAQGEGALDAWVGVSVEVGPVDAYLYYGAELGLSRASPWTAYAGVWHMNGSAGEVDSSGRDDVATIDGSTTPGEATGIVGNARTYNGTSDALGTGSAAPALQFGTGSFTYEMWVDATLLDNGHTPCPLWQGGSSPQAPGYDFQLGSGTWQVEVVDGSGDLAFAGLGNGSELAARWTQLAGVLDRDAQTLTAYADGAAVTSKAVSLGSLDNTNDFEIGRVGQTTEFPGAIDEVRVLAGALQPGWFAAEYANVNPATRGGFVVVGNEQVPP